MTSRKSQVRRRSYPRLRASDEHILSIVCLTIFVQSLTCDLRLVFVVLAKSLLSETIVKGFLLGLTVNNVRTVSDTKRAFYNLHTRPINTIYRRVVEELMVEMHLLSVNVDFSYNPIYDLGVLTSFERFMQGYQPDPDKDSIFTSLCQAVEKDPQEIRQEAERLQAFAKNISVQELIAWIGGEIHKDGTEDLQLQFQAIASNPNFKYSRLFAIGVFTLLELADPELVKDEKQRTEALKQMAAALKISEDKLQKDLDLYRSNLDKMAQALIVMADMLEAERKKRLQRSEASAAIASPPADAPSQTSSIPQDKAPSA